MVQDTRETQLDVAAKNRVAIFYENGGPEKISIKELDNVKESDLNPGEVLVRVRSILSFPNPSTYQNVVLIAFI